jgi:hypothetical protein
VPIEVSLASHVAVLGFVSGDGVREGVDVSDDLIARLPVRDLSGRRAGVALGSGRWER